MEQIYYTQCPMGYGLGTSSGFQVKRADPDYPLRGDFRHLTLRAFLPSRRVLAPETLRYRLAEDGTAEVALLTSRTHEYQTERGLWGRPGGHFAHGLTLDSAAMKAIRHWPAGLIGGAFWRRADPEPTLGRRPDAVELLAPLAPDFSTAAALAEGRESGLLGSLLTALATVSRGGGTLILVDRPERLAETVALLTLAFPEVWRRGLTFSTYHDRPEELLGYRIHGTTPEARFDRPVHSSAGFRADLVAGTIDPPASPARWARTLAAWLVGRSDRDRSSWEATNRRASEASLSSPIGDLWSDDQLDFLYDLPALTEADPPVPTAPADWSRLAEVAAWSKSRPWASALVEARRASWWFRAAEISEPYRTALHSHMELAGNWSGPRAASAWGATVARSLELIPDERGIRFLDKVVPTVPGPVRHEFLRVVMEPCDPAFRRKVWKHLRESRGVEPLELLPMEVGELADRYQGAEFAGKLRVLLDQAAKSPPCLVAVLDALAVQVQEKARIHAQAVAEVSDQLMNAKDDTARSILGWLLDGGPESRQWLGAALLRAAANPDGPERWKRLGTLVEPSRKGVFASITLKTAADASAPAGLFPWVLETFLFSVPGRRPHHASWPSLYLDRLISDLVLLRRLFARPYRELGIRAWFVAARERDELTAAQEARLDRCDSYVRALKTGDAHRICEAGLPAVPPSERGALLAQVLGHVQGRFEDGLAPVLDACRAAWPNGFAPGSEGLSSIGAALAGALTSVQVEPSAWLSRVEAVSERLGLLGESTYGLEPDSLAAEILAAATRGEFAGGMPWALRKQVLRNPGAWRILGADVRIELREKNVAESLAALETWDRLLPKGAHSDRFFEVWLNSCESPALAATVAARAADLRTLRPLAWWQWREAPGANNDLRDAFARRAPLVPIDEDALAPLRAWIGAPGDRDQADSLSESARSRWLCLDALSSFHRPGLDAEACWQVVEGWTRGLSLSVLSLNDRYLFLAWLIPRLEGDDSVRVARLASWLVRGGLSDPDRIAGWAGELARFVDVDPGSIGRRERLVSALRGEWKAVLRDARARPGKTAKPDSPRTP